MAPPRRREQQSPSSLVWSIYRWLHATILALVAAVVRLFHSESSLSLQNGVRVNYDETRPIAEGGSAFVFKAHDGRRRGQTFALKKMLCQTMEQRDQATAEMDAHREFHHPNVMPLVNWTFAHCGTQGEAAFMLFPFMGGGSLRDVINLRVLGNGSPFSEPEILQLFRGTAEGLAQLHGHTPAWAHRDVKPENVMLTLGSSSSLPTPVLMDLGSVAPADIVIKNRTHALAVQDEASQFCTLPYRAPELFDVSSDAVLDARTDVWSLGCLLFALAFGYSPFECDFVPTNGNCIGGGGGGGDQGYATRVVECSFLRVIAPLVWPPSHRFSPGFVSLVTAMLQQDAKKRPHIAQVIEMVEELQRGSTGESAV